MDAVDKLLSEHIDPTASSFENGETALHLACCAGMVNQVFRMCEIIKENFLNTDIKDIEGSTAMHYLAYSNTSSDLALIA
jgi:ankyrin repeat protein